MERKMYIDHKLLDAVFGEESTGETKEERAQTSNRIWLRTQNYLFIDHPERQGLRLSSRDALEIFGIELLYEAAERGSALIAMSREEPGLSLFRVRDRIGLTQAELAEKAHVSLKEVQDAENPSTQTRMFVLGRICKALGLDVKRISFVAYR